MSHTLSFARLDDTDFEEFASDMLHELGFVNVDWRKGTAKKTSPSDRGRDIECDHVVKDVDGTIHLEHWFADCKHFRQGVPPRELQNLLTWAESKRPDVALFIISGFLSNPAKDYIADYQENRRPPFRIRVWEKPQITRMLARKVTFLRRFGLIEEPIRSIRAILNAEREFFDRVWYDRKLLFIQRTKETARTPKEILKGMWRGMREVEQKYGRKNLGPYDKFEWGMINGKLSALRWVLGEDWDILDT